MLIKKLFDLQIMMTDRYRNELRQLMLKDIQYTKNIFSNLAINLYNKSGLELIRNKIIGVQLSRVNDYITFDI